MIEVLVQNDPYRYVKMPDLLENGQPDYRIQKWNNHNGYKDMYPVSYTHLTLPTTPYV